MLISIVVVDFAFSMLAVTLPDPMLFGEYVISSPKPAVFLLMVPLLELKPRVIGYVKSLNSLISPVASS